MGREKQKGKRWREEYGAMGEARKKRGNKDGDMEREEKGRGSG